MNEEREAPTAPPVAPHLMARPVALLVDGDNRDRFQLAHELTNHGFDVEVSDDIDAAIATSLRRQPALLVMELRLRTGNGLDLLTRLRPELPATRFVVLTQYGSVATAVRAMRLGATNYLCKPAGIAEVLRAAADWASDDVGSAAENDTHASVPPSLTLDEAIWEYISRTIEDAGSLSEAARRLGLWRQSLKRKVSKYRPGPPRARTGAPAAPR